MRSGCEFKSQETCVLKVLHAKLSHQIIFKMKNKTRSGSNAKHMKRNSPDMVAFIARNLLHKKGRKNREKKVNEWMNGKEAKQELLQIFNDS